MRNKEIKDLFLSCIPPRKEEGKHDGHVNDDKIWCYTCGESADEEEFTQNEQWNKCREEMIKNIEEKIK